MLGGAALGAVTLLVFAQIKDWAYWRQAPLWAHLGLILVVGLLSFASWPDTAPAYVPLLGTMLMAVLVGNALLPFAMPQQVWQRALAALFGAVAFMGLQVALKQLEQLLGLEPMLWQGVRGVLMGGFVGLLMPWLLMRARLLPVVR